MRNMATNGGNLFQRTRCYYFYDIDMPCNKREPGTGCSALWLQPDSGDFGHKWWTWESVHCTFPSDMCVALAALEAACGNGPRWRTYPANRRFSPSARRHPWLDNNLKKGEVVTGIDLPPKASPEIYSYLKLRDRNSYAFALVSVAKGLEQEGTRSKKPELRSGEWRTNPGATPTPKPCWIGKPATNEKITNGLPRRW